MTNSAISLNYDTLVSDYEEGLTNQLRGFRSGPEFLETWVHDSDPGRSIYGIFEAAREAGVPELSLEMGFESTRDLNFSSLGSQLRVFGEVRIGTAGEGTVIKVRFT